MSFLGLDIAVSGLRAQQIAMNVTAHNIANAGTEGYHRQQAVTTAGTPLSGALTLVNGSPAQLGTGTMVQSIRRLQSTYIDGQVRNEQQLLGSWSYRNTSLSQVESIFAEPGDYGLATAFDEFWDSWQELSVSTQSNSAKISVVQNGVAVSQRINNLYGGLRSIQNQADDDLVANADEVNRLATELAHLNEQIGIAAANTTNQPSDLLDKRDTLLNELSQIIKIQTNNTTGSNLIVSIGGKVLVQNNKVTEISITEDANGWSQLSWSDDGSTVSVTGGEILGQMEVRDNLIGDYIDKLNTIASKLVEEVNALYSSGTTASGNPAGNFFIPGSDASSIAVNPDLIATPSDVATSYTGNSGANDLALAIAELKDKDVMTGNESIYEAYTSLVSKLGADTAEAESRTTLHTLSLQQLDTQSESVAGVSLDEEMSNMVRFQQSYNAVARLFTTIDEMLATLMSMGTVGR